jgi:predicted ABC-type ATPase
MVKVLLLKPLYLPRVIKIKLKRHKEKGYTVTLLFFWLQNVELAKERVKIRVMEGGHNIAPEVIERRYLRGIQNLFDIYLNWATNLGRKKK